MNLCILSFCLACEVLLILLLRLLGASTVHSYLNATYVHFNPPSPDVVQQRIASLGHLERPSNDDFLH